MPLYKKDIKEAIIKREDFEIFLTRCHTPDKRLLMMVLYITGARPSEIVLIEKKDITWNDNTMFIQLQTKKRDKKTNPNATIPTVPIKHYRMLQIPRKICYVNDIINIVEKMPDGKVTGIKTPMGIEMLVFRVTLKRYSPYSFRHSRMFKLAQAGASPYELMYFKGSNDVKSVSEYVLRAGTMTTRILELID